LHEIDRRLREAKILIEGYRIDPIIGFVAVKIDFMRSLRPDDDPYKVLLKESGMAACKIIEKLFDGLPGYVVVTDAELRIEDFGTETLSIKTTVSLEHTYVLKDGKYLCEWGDPANPIHEGRVFQKKRPVREELTNAVGMPILRYHL
jgi:hypothetical protein